MSSIIKYYEALDRLIKNNPNIVSKGTKISKRSVALEAGVDESSIKISREGHSELIKDIQKAKDKQQLPQKKTEADVEKYKELAKKYKSKYHDSLNRELMLIDRLKQLERTQ